MPDLIARILRELDGEIVRLESELSRMRIIRDRMVEPIIPGEVILRRPDGRGYARVVREPTGEPLVTKTGRVLTDEDIEKLADEAERGYEIGAAAVAYEEGVEAPEKPQESAAPVAQVETPSEAPEAQKVAPVLPVLPGISPELVEKLAQDGVPLRPLSVTHLPPHVPSRDRRKTERRVIRKPRMQRGPEEMETAIRDWVRAQGDKEFTASDIAAGIGIHTPSYAIDRAKSLIERGVIVEVGRAPGRGAPVMFRYGGKPSPQPQLAGPVKGNGGEDRVPAWRTEAGVPGTGAAGNRQTTDKDINALLRQISDQVHTRPAGSGHVIVTSRRTGQATSVSSTPSAANTLEKVRADLRRIGVRF